jgi:hypothetical protein
VIHILNLIRRKKILAVALVLVVLATTQSSCDKDRIKEAAKASDRLAVLIGSAIDLKRDLGPSGQSCQTFNACITRDEELLLTTRLLQANTRVKQFNEFARKQTEDTPQTRLDLASAFNSVMIAIGNLSGEAIFPIKNAEAKKRLLAILNSINVSIQLIDAALKG